MTTSTTTPAAPAARAFDPSHVALLVMDVLPATLDAVGQTPAYMERVERALAVARAQHATVAYVRMAFEEDDLHALPEENKLASHVAAADGALDKGSTTTAIPDPVAPEEGDIVVRKTRVGAFSTTDLDRQLRARSVTTLVLSGISTSGVVLSTLRDAADRDYRMYVLSDASTDPQPDVHSFLVERVFPSQAEVLTVDDFERLMERARTPDP